MDKPRSCYAERRKAGVRHYVAFSAVIVGVLLVVGHILRAITQG